jgi:hypothetical protein
VRGLGAATLTTHLSMVAGFGGGWLRTRRRNRSERHLDHLLSSRPETQASTLELHLIPNSLREVS